MKAISKKPHKKLRSAAGFGRLKFKARLVFSRAFFMPSSAFSSEVDAGSLENGVSALAAYSVTIL
jgi:hypothetical protein